ncbi:Elongation factor Tu, partial [Bienertia sinuspersici]
GSLQQVGIRCRRWEHPDYLQRRIGIANVDPIANNLLLLEHDNKVATLVEEIYPDLLNRYSDIEYLTEPAIRGPTNDCVEDINNYMLSMLPGLEVIHQSVDNPPANRSAIDEELHPKET